jgi:choloylglycine hydrolase
VKNISNRLIIVITMLLFSISHYANACTDFRVKASDGTIIIARSMEFAEDFKSNLRTSTRGRTFNTIALDGKPALSWKAKYGFVYLDGMNVDVAIDGMNEAGLSVEALYLPSFAQYQTVPAGHNNQALPYINFGDWILSNFKSVEEVRQALPSIYVFAAKTPGMGDMIFPLHFSVFDNSGKGIVIEYVKGKLNVYDHIGVMTNSPTYDWQLTNLNNYIHLAPINPPAVVANGIIFAATGQGFGMIGLPGDISPPSRFVKTATLLRVALPAANATAAVNLAEHVINNVDIVRGESRQPLSGNYIDETTQWVVFKDLTHRIFYYRTYEDLSLRAVALEKINFSENAPRLVMPILSKGYVNNVTDQFLKATQPSLSPVVPATK